MTVSDGLELVRDALINVGEATPSQLVEMTGLAQSTVSQYLREIVDMNLASSHREGKRRYYAPRPALVFDCTVSIPNDPTNRLLRRAWRASRIDWRFPLASQVRDPNGQRATERFLVGSQERGLMTPWLRPGALGTDDVIGALDDTVWQAVFREHLTKPAAWGSWQLFVFGSCARGDARAESDLDLLAVGPARGDWERRCQQAMSLDGEPGASLPYPDWSGAFRTVASELNLDGPRFIDLHFAAADDLDSLPPPLLDKIVAEGVLVHATDGQLRGTEALL